MGTYYIPRNLRGETRILYIFTVKSLITTAIGGILVGGPLFLLIGMALGQKTIGFIVMGVCAVIGWAIGAIKIPTVAGLPFTKNIGGESLDEIIRRYVKFKASKKLYTYINLKPELNTKEKGEK